MSIRAVRNMNAKNETPSWMMNEWITIWRQLSSGSSLFQEGARKWSSFCLFSDWLWLTAACDYWCLTLFPAWFGVVLAAFRLSVSHGCRRSAAPSFCAWTLTSPQGLGWCEPQSQKVNTYCKSVCQSSRHLRQVSRRLCKYSLWMMLFWGWFFWGFFSLLCPQCVKTQQPCSFFADLRVSVQVRCSGFAV